jgi:hypothetical protein
VALVNNLKACRCSATAALLCRQPSQDNLKLIMLQEREDSGVSRYDMLVINITMGIVGVLVIIGILSLVKRDKANVIWLTALTLAIGTCGSYFLMTGALLFVFPSSTSPYVIIAISLPFLAGFVLLLWKAKVFDVKGGLAIVAMALLLGYIGGHTTAVKANENQAVRDAFTPLLQKKYTTGVNPVSPEPYFIIYDSDADKFEFNKEGMFTYYSTDVEKIKTIVFYSKTTKHVGKWVTEDRKKKVAEAYSESIKVTVVDVKTWSVIASKSFESVVNAPRKQNNKYTNTISITDGQIKKYLNELFSETDG